MGGMELCGLQLFFWVQGFHGHTCEAYSNIEITREQKPSLHFSVLLLFIIGIKKEDKVL